MLAFIKSLFKGKDGDVAFVRVFGAIGFIMIIFMITIGVPLWTLIAKQRGVQGLPTLQDWASYYTGAAVLVTAAFGGMASWLWVKERPSSPNGTPGQ